MKIFKKAPTKKGTTPTKRAFFKPREKDSQPAPKINIMDWANVSTKKI